MSTPPFPLSVPPFPPLYSPISFPPCDLPSETDLVDLLTRIPEGAWVEIEEPDGWKYHTNIGNLTHRAAAEITRLRTLLKLSLTHDEITYPQRSE